MATLEEYPDERREPAVRLCAVRAAIAVGGRPGVRHCLRRKAAAPFAYIDGWYDTGRIQARLGRPSPGRSAVHTPAPAAAGLDELVAHGAARSTWEHFVRIRIHAPREDVARWLPRTAGVLTAIDARSCWLDTGADDPASLLRHLAMLDLDLTVPDAPELAAEVAKLAERYARAVFAPSPPEVLGPPTGLDVPGQ